jgi:hypothetical protein
MHDYGGGNLVEGDNLEDTDFDGKIIFKYTFKKWSGSVWIGLTCGKSCEHTNEPMGSIKCGEFDYLRNCGLLKKYFTE